MSMLLVNVLFRMVMLLAPLMSPPMPVMPSRVNPESPEPKLTCICGLAPEAAATVIALLVPVQVP